MIQKSLEGINIVARHGRNFHPDPDTPDMPAAPLAPEKFPLLQISSNERGAHFLSGK